MIQNDAKLQNRYPFCSSSLGTYLNNVQYRQGPRIAQTGNQVTRLNFKKTTIERTLNAPVISKLSTSCYSHIVTLAKTVTNLKLIPTGRHE